MTDCIALYVSPRSSPYHQRYSCINTVGPVITMGSKTRTTNAPAIASSARQRNGRSSAKRPAPIGKILTKPPPATAHPVRHGRSCSQATNAATISAVTSGLHWLHWIERTRSPNTSKRTICAGFRGSRRPRIQ